MTWIFLLKLYRTVATALAENCKKPYGDIFFLFIIFIYIYFETKQMALASNIEDLPTQNRGAGTLYVGRRIILDTFQGMCASKR